MIRKATHDDIPSLLRIGRQYYATSGYAEYAPMDDASAIGVFETTLNHGVFLVSEDERGVTGMLGAVIVPFMFNNAISTASETVFFVDKDATQQGVGGALLDAWIEACRTSGVRVMQGHGLTDSNRELSALYASRGFNPSEYSVSKVL